MAYTYLIAKKYLWTKRKTGFISVIAYISIAGVALGTAALIITLCIVSGFEREMRLKFISFDAHVRLKTFEGMGLMHDRDAYAARIRRMNHVSGVSPYVEKEAMIRSKRATDGVIVKGIDQTTVDQVLNIRKDVIASRGSSPIDLVKPTDSAAALPGILIGKKLADKLTVSLGDKVTLFSLKNTPAFVEQPRVRQFTVTGVYRSGLAEYDNVMVYVDIAEAQKLFDYHNAINGFEIKLDNLDEASDVADSLMAAFGYPHYARTWFDLHRNLFSWLETNNLLMMIIFSLIIMVAAFNIIGTLFMIVIEKTKDIGILKSMGVPERGIRRIFMFEGLLIGVIGSGCGALLAWILCEWQERFKVIALSSDVYFMDAVPIQLNPWYFIVIAVFAVLLCVLATVYPSLKASKLNAVEAIRYE